MPENEDAWDLWMSVHTQWRSSGFGRIGLVYEEVRAQAERLGIEIDTGIWLKIVALENDVLKRQAEDGKKKAAGSNGDKSNRIGSKKSRKGHSRR